MQSHASLFAEESRALKVARRGITKRPSKWLARVRKRIRRRARYYKAMGLPYKSWNAYALVKGD